MTLMIWPTCFSDLFVIYFSYLDQQIGYGRIAVSALVNIDQNMRI